MNSLWLRLSVALAFGAVPAAAQSVTALLYSGPSSVKQDLVIVGDGYTSSQQAAFNSFVDTVVMNGMFQRDIFREAKNAFNVWRVNANSVDSGVTQVNASGAVTVARNTALDYRYSGIWSRCWMEPGPNTNSRLASILAATVPGAEYVFIVLNEPGGGGCRRGNTLAVTSASGWSTCAHEMGHMVGNLGDEYWSGSVTYTGAEPTAANLTRQTSRALIKWGDYIPPTRPIPTTSSHVTDPVHDVGLFAGGTFGSQQFANGVFHPALSSRMRANSPEFCPVGYEAFRDALTGAEVREFHNRYLGDFDGDGRDDLVLHNAISLQLYLSDGTRLQPTWFDTGFPYYPEESFLVADFDGDGRDDLYGVFPGVGIGMFRSTGSSFVLWGFYLWNLPGWALRPGDRMLTGDWNGDGRADLALFNGSDWSIPYLGMFTSGGNSLNIIARYDGSMPGWTMARNDRHFVGDFDGDGRDEIGVFNGVDWSIRYLAIQRSTGAGLAHVVQYGGNLPGWGMAANDQHFVGDFDNDGHDDLYIFNGQDWATPYLSMMRSLGTGLAQRVRYDGSNPPPGWGMTAGDRFHVGDVNGDGRSDLVVFNATNWATEYLGILQSTGSALSGTWQADWVGNWNLGPDDRVGIANFSGGSGWDDVVIHNDDWLGLLRSNATSFSSVRLYPKYIRNVSYHRLAWW